MLVLHMPSSRENERRYISNVVFDEFLGLRVQLAQENRDDWCLTDTTNHCQLTMPDSFLGCTQDAWLKPASLPKTPLSTWRALEDLPEATIVESGIPVIAGKKNLHGDWFTRIEDKSIWLGLDVLGSAFFMLTRYEEYVKQDRDQHDRFPAKASLAYQEGFLDRPIINEYIEILWWCMKRLWPRLERKKRSFRTIVTHDVDVPFAQAFTGVLPLIRNCGGDVLKRKSFTAACNRLKTWRDVKKGDYKKDLNYTFDRIMDISEQNNIKSAFYFKTACTNPNYDNNYSIDHPYLRQLIRDIDNRGHEIGFHPSYETFQNPEQTKVEFYKLLQVCEEEGIEQDQWGGRQHYLRWQVPITWRNWAKAGINYDSTLSFADHASFRCGICYEFPVFDLEQRKPLPLMERPLIVMEGSVLGEKYMALNGEAALEYMLELKRRCNRYNGDFTLLWHNSSFGKLDYWMFYESLV